jgi:hypothetical protein
MTDILQIERNFKMVRDIRIESENKRVCIYEIGVNKKYVCIVKQNGEVVKISHAQNVITLILKNCN